MYKKMCRISGLRHVIQERVCKVIWGKPMFILKHGGNTCSGVQSQVMIVSWVQLDEFLLWL